MADNVPEMNKAPRKKYVRAVGPRLRILLLCIFGLVAVLAANSIYLGAITCLEWLKGDPNVTYQNWFYMVMFGTHLGLGLLLVLPELNRSQRYLSFPHPATPEFLDDLLADPEVNYILARVGAFPPTLRIWMSQHGFQIVFEEQGYDFFELPANRTGSGIRIFSADVRATFRGIVSGSLQGVGFRKGDLVVINGKDTYPAMFISEHELSFQVPSTLLGGPFFLWLMRRDRRLATI